jgi:hypothetical protein
MAPITGIGYYAGPARRSFGRIAMDEDRFNIALRKFLKVVGITSQREIERVVREGKVEGTELKLRMTLTAESPSIYGVSLANCPLPTPASEATG